ncbi:MAG: peptidyl-prolyl cis-trans isomerase [Pseudomonadota bacterium]
MLEVIRKWVGGFIAKLLIGLLVLSFAVWGIADMITGVGSSTIASVGNKDISVHEFRQRYYEQVSLISARFGQRLTPQQARAVGIENSVLSSMIGALAIDIHAQELNLSVTDNVVEDDIRRDPLFQGSDGNFSPRLLEQVRNRLGMDEAQMIETRRDEIVREQLTGAILENVTIPETLFEIYRTFNREQRKVRYFTIDPKTALKISAQPDDAALKEIYEANKSRFMTDETRDVEILMLTRDDAEKKIDISEAELKARYERDKDNYSVPESRKVLQIPFKSVEEAQKARSEILGGQDFAAVAEANGVQKTDMDLGKVTKAQLIDPKIANAAFSLKNGEVSDVIEGRFSTVLVKVTEITPGKVPSFDEVKDQVRDSIAATRAPDEIRKLHDLVDDNRLAGKTFKEIADLLQITFQTAVSVNQSGQGRDGKPVISSPDLGKIIASAFDSAKGVENEVIELTDGGYAWTKVLKVTASEQRPFKDVKDDAKKIWLEKKEREALAKLAQDYVKKLEDGAAFDEIAKEAGGEVKVTLPFKRNDSLPDLSSAAVNRAFTMAKDVAASAPATGGQSRVIFEVTDIVAPGKPTDDEKKQMEQLLLQGLYTDVIQQYVLALRNRLDVTTNQSLIDRTVGIADQSGG